MAVKVKIQLMKLLKCSRNTFEGIELVKVEIPTEFYKSIEVLRSCVEKEKPEVVICVGQAGGRFTVSVERVAINLDDARIPDNGGNQPVDQAIVKDGPAAYFSTIANQSDCKCHQRRWNTRILVSNSAGTYVCNHIMYGLMHMISTRFPEIRGGFIHVPFLEEQVLDKPNMPSMGLESISKGTWYCSEDSL